MEGCEFPAQVLPDPSAAVDKKDFTRRKMTFFIISPSRIKRGKAGRTQGVLSGILPLLRKMCGNISRSSISTSACVKY